MDFYTRVRCPKCGGDVEHLVKTRIPPIHVTRCKNCEWSEEERTVVSDIFFPSESSVIRQGWQCPVCRRVYSPDTVMCLKCGDAETITVTYSGTDGTTGSVTHQYKQPDINDITGFFCDDISFCQEQCDWKTCPRNSQNIRDHSIPHSFIMGLPPDCPKKNNEKENE